MTDPRFTDPRLSDPMIRRDEWTSGRDENVGGMWSWVAGVSLLLLIGFLIFAGWNSNSNTANEQRNDRHLRWMRRIDTSVRRQSAF